MRVHKQSIAAYSHDQTGASASIRLSLGVLRSGAGHSKEAGGRATCASKGGHAHSGNQPSPSISDLLGRNDDMSHAPQNPVRPAWSKPGRGGRKPSSLGETEPVTVEEKLRRIVSEVLAVEESDLVSTARLVDFEADSLDAVEISVRCEEVFEIEFSEDFAADELETFGEWLRVVRRMVQRRVGEGAEVTPVEG